MIPCVLSGAAMAEVVKNRWNGLKKEREGSEEGKRDC
jgi:hypothetical protein